MKDNKLNIRTIQPGEESLVCDLVTHVSRQFILEEFTPEGYGLFQTYANPDAMADRVKAGGLVLVCESATSIVGMIELRGENHIALFFVKSLGQGIGRALFDAAIQIKRRETPGLTEITVHASLFAVPAYVGLGFEPTGPECFENGIKYVPMEYRIARVLP